MISDTINNIVRFIKRDRLGSEGYTVRKVKEQPKVYYNNLLERNATLHNDKAIFIKLVYITAPPALRVAKSFNFTPTGIERLEAKTLDI